MAARRKRKTKSRASRSERRRAIYVLPNLFTTTSLFLGFFALVSAMEGNFEFSALAIFASLVFDGLDGTVARATNTTSRFGVEYDSLADLVAFGVAPAVLAHQWALEPMGRLGILTGFLFVACGALRLARFNVQTETVGAKHFVGLPIPAAACMVASSVLFCQTLGITGQLSMAWPVVTMIFLLSFLMVSNIPFLSFKELGLADLKSFNWLVAGLLFFVLVAIQPYVMGFVLLTSYVTLGHFGARLMAKRKAQKEAEAQARQKQTATNETPAQPPA